MLKKIEKIIVFCPLLLILLLGCDTAKSERSDHVIVNTTRATSPTEIAKTKFQDESAESLCSRLHEIKKLPDRDPNDTDPIYEALIAKGNEATPCLIEKITDETPMPDPREAPPYQFYTVGDTAVFILADIAKDQDLLLKMLPPAYEKEWETNGVYAYFNYVSESKNRKELQKWWRRWIKENSSSDGK